MTRVLLAAVVAALLFGCVALGYGVAAVWPEPQSEPWPPPAPPAPGYAP